MTTVIEGPFYAQLQAFAAKQGLTQPALLLATLTLFLHQLLGDTDCTLSATASNRNSRFYGNLDVSGLIGFFANVLLIRTTVAVDMPVLAYLHQVQDNFLEALDYDAYPLLRLVEELPDLTPDGLYYATGFFNYHNYQHVTTSGYSAARPEAQQVEVIAPMRRAYGLTVTEHANGLHVQFKVNSAAFARVEAPVTLQAFLGLLQQVVQHPLRPIHELQQHPQAVPAQ
jgi:non-ribosomal peptide synthetase component F